MFRMCVLHVICSLIYAPSSPCRSAVPAGPHVLCLCGIGSYKEIRATQRWRKNGRHWWFPWRMTHIVSRAGDGGRGWGVWFRMSLGPVSYRTKQSSVISQVWLVCAVPFFYGQDQELIVELWTGPGWNVASCPWRCFGVLLYDCTTSHSIWKNFIYEILYLSIQWLFWFHDLRDVFWFYYYYYY